MKIGVSGAKPVFKCCKCGKLSNVTIRNSIAIGTPPGTKYFCKECSGTGRGGLYNA